MTRKQWTLTILLSLLSTISFLSISEAVPLPTTDAASDAQNKPVVAPIPNGVDPSSPNVSSEPPDEVQTSTPTPVTTNSKQ